MVNRSAAFKKAILAALEKKMVFLGGPRQSGKTTFAISLLGERMTEKHPSYLNWDDPTVPARLRAKQLPAGKGLLVLDEIHKYARWRNLVKGIYDTEKSDRKILVTGSARLDHYRKGGDSLVNRYRYFRLHPFSLLELNPQPSQKDLDLLLRYSGFPEPLFAQDEAEWRIWQRDRISRVIHDDLRNLERVQEISLLEHLVELLPPKVGSPLSVKSLREDLEVDHKTAERWIQILENLYVCFRVAPYGAPKVRAVKKERKLYLWDWSMVEKPGPRFENLVASQLLKYCHWLEDTQGYRMELRFLRDTDQREIDFVVLKQGKPEFAVECKTGDGNLSPAIRYFAERTPIPRFFQVHQGTKRYASGRAEILPWIDFCVMMRMP